VSASLDLAAPKLGSGARFKKLSTTLAARGASNPDGLAAFIGRKRYGARGMGRLSAGKSLANDDLGIYLADGPQPYHRDPDENVRCPSCQKYNDTDARYCDQCGAKLPASAFADLSNAYGLAADDSTMTCPACGHKGTAGEFGPRSPSGTSDGPSGSLRTPSPSTGGVRSGVPLTVRGGSARALANSTRDALELAAGTRTARPAVSGPYDVGVKRGGVLYHRRGGNEIGQVRKNDDGTWTAVVAGKPLAAHQHQRAALMEAVGTYNAAVHAGTARRDAPLQPPPQQTELMAEYGIPAMRSAAFANTTPVTSSGAGPRMTTAASSSGKFDPDKDGDDDSSASGDTDKDAAGGLSPKALAIYKKLKAKGFPTARALAFAKNSEKFGKPAAA